MGDKDLEIFKAIQDAFKELKEDFNKELKATSGSVTSEIKTVWNAVDGMRTDIKDTNKENVAAMGKIREALASNKVWMTIFKGVIIFFATSAVTSLIWLARFYFVHGNVK